MVERGKRIKINPVIDNIELFKREYLCQWIEPSKEYQEAYKLWLWYFYNCELYDSIICTGRNEYEDFMPRTNEEMRLININASNNLRYIQTQRKNLKETGININEEDWNSAKRNFDRYKLQSLQEEYNHYFNKEII